MKNGNRCGAMGIFQKTSDGVVFVVEKLITEIVYENRLPLQLPADICVGECITIEQISNEHRGIVIFDRCGTYIDEGELSLRNSHHGQEWVFTSDYNGILFTVSLSRLLEHQIKLKPEVYDQVGAARRLRAIKHTLQAS